MKEPDQQSGRDETLTGRPAIAISIAISIAIGGAEQSVAAALAPGASGRPAGRGQRQ